MALHLLATRQGVAAGVHSTIQGFARYPRAGSLRPQPRTQERPQALSCIGIEP